MHNLPVFDSIIDAIIAAQNHFGSSVGIEKATGSIVEFYGNDELFTENVFPCVIRDGVHRICKDAGQVHESVLTF